MIVKSLEKMEKIVANHKNLKWVGWDILDLSRSEFGRTSVNGIRINNEWFTYKKYAVNHSGWDIPNKYKE